MTFANLPEKAQNLLAVSQGMLASAKADDWEAVIETDAMRRPMIDQVIAQGAPNDAPPAEWMREFLEEHQEEREAWAERLDELDVPLDSERRG